MTKTYLVQVVYMYDNNKDMALRDTFKEAQEFIEEAVTKDHTVYYGTIYQLDTTTKEIKEWHYNELRGLVEV